MRYQKSARLQKKPVLAFVQATFVGIQTNMSWRDVLELGLPLG